MAIARAQDVYTQWSHNKNITINTTSSGLGVSGNVYNFPYVVRLSFNSFNFGEAMKNGQDIRFAKSNGDHLQYQINTWDSAKDATVNGLAAAAHGNVPNIVPGIIGSAQLFDGNSDSYNAGTSGKIQWTGYFRGFRGQRIAQSQGKVCAASGQRGSRY